MNHEVSVAEAGRVGLNGQDGTYNNQTMLS